MEVHVSGEEYGWEVTFKLPNNIADSLQRESSEQQRHVLEQIGDMLGGLAQTLSRAFDVGGPGGLGKAVGKVEGFLATEMELEGIKTLN